MKSSEPYCEVLEFIIRKSEKLFTETRISPYIVSLEDNNSHILIHLTSVKAKIYTGSIVHNTITIVSQGDRGPHKYDNSAWQSSLQ